MSNKPTKKLATLTELKKLADKYNVSGSGSRATVAENLATHRGRYLTKREMEMIMPFIKKRNKNAMIFKKIQYPRALKKASLKAKLAKKRRLVKKAKKL
jgi:hypothetical protein